MAAAFYLAHHEDVGALEVAAAVAAFEPRRAMRVQHGGAARRLRARQAVEAFARMAQRKAARQRHLAGRQHVHHVTLAVFEDLERGGAARQRTDERRVGTEWVSKCRYRWEP